MDPLFLSPALSYPAAGELPPRPLALVPDPAAPAPFSPWPAWVRVGEPASIIATPPRREPAGRPVAWLRDEEGHDLPALSVGSGGRCRFHFDPVATARHLLSEGYAGLRRPLYSRVPWLVAALPGPLRLAGHGLSSLLEGLRHRAAPGAGFPAFPAEPALELLRLLVTGAAATAGEQAPPRWPGGAASVVLLTHDVDTALGQGRMLALARAEEARGLRSCFYIVGDRFALDHGLLGRLRDAGHEIGLHGTRHDARLAYLSPRAIAARLDRCQGMVERHEVVGFRSPALLVSPRLTRQLTGRFLYDSSVPDTDVDSVAAPRRGCCSLLPYWQGPLLQLPLTLPLDDRLMLQHPQDPDRALQIWQTKLDWIRQLGGLAVVTNHAEPHLSGAGPMLAAYQRLLGWITERRRPVALPREVAAHWAAMAAPPRGTP